MTDDKNNNLTPLLASYAMFVLVGAIPGFMAGRAMSPGFHAMPPEMASTLRWIIAGAGAVGGVVTVVASNVKAVEANNVSFGCGGFMLGGIITGAALGAALGTLTEPSSVALTLDTQTAHIANSLAALDFIPKEKLPDAVAEFKAELANAARVLLDRPQTFFASLPREALSNSAVMKAASMLNVDVSGINLAAAAGDALQIGQNVVS